MDALIQYLRASGTGQAKIALVEKVAAGRTLRECRRDIDAALRAAGFEGTAMKIGTWLVETRPDDLRDPEPLAATLETNDTADLGTLGKLHASGAPGDEDTRPARRTTAKR